MAYAYFTDLPAALRFLRTWTAFDSPSWSIFWLISPLWSVFWLIPPLSSIFWQITQDMRKILLDWLIKICYHYKLCGDSLHLMVNILDRYTEKRQCIDRMQYQLVGVTSLLIATKQVKVYRDNLSWTSDWDIYISVGSGYTVSAHLPHALS